MNQDFPVVGASRKYSHYVSTVDTKEVSSSELLPDQLLGGSVGVSSEWNYFLLAKTHHTAERTHLHY